ncbi:MAG: alpha/beta hydrolase [Pseudoclavibacter sp.]|nr:alpha/beta hydrolase [Pseudoclavibacter sp.]
MSGRGPAPLAVLCLLALLLGFAPAAPRQAAQAEPRIVDYEVEFTVENVNRSRSRCTADGERYTIRGHLTGPEDGLAAPAPAVAFMLHGTNTGEWIWRSGIPGHDYARALASRGHSTLTVDRLGYGRSDAPDGFASCSGAHADIAHQIVQQLRRGAYTIVGRDPVAFERVVLGGHSSGALLAETVAVSFGGVDALMLSGWAAVGITDETNRRFLAAYRSCLAGGEPRAGVEGPGGYVHFDPDREDFLAGGFGAEADPAVLAWAQGRWQRAPCGVMVSEPMAILHDLDTLAEIDVPVQLVFGAHDALRRGVEGYPGLFTGSPRVEALTLPDAGHFVTLDAGAGEFYAAAAAWLDRSAPPGG